MTFTFERTWDLLNTIKKIIMKYKVFTEDVFEGVKNSPVIKEFFSEEFYKLKTQRYYNIFLDEISKLTSIPCDVSNKQSPTTSELLNMMQSV